MPLPTSRLAQVFLFQPQVQHYRLALWDGLVDRGRGRYELSVYGPLEDGGAFGGGQRPYLHPTDEVLMAEGRFELRRSPDLPELVNEHRPDVVVVGVNLRNLTQWNIRRSCRQVPVRWVAHTKVQAEGCLRPSPIGRREHPAPGRVSHERSCCSGGSVRGGGVAPAHARHVERSAVAPRRARDRSGQRGRAARPPGYEGLYR